MKTNFQVVVNRLNELIALKRPEYLTSSWVLRHASACYRFIRKNIRTEWGTIDWDRVTSSLDRRYQRLWRPNPRPKRINSCKHQDELDIILNKYREKLYVFVAHVSRGDRTFREVISIRMVRLAQCGNLRAKQELMSLMEHLVDEWMDQSEYLSRWTGYDEKIQSIIEGCIRRYRYSGSFLNYVYRTLQNAARGIQPLYAYSLDETVAINADKRKIEDVVRDPETGEIGLYSRRSASRLFQSHE